MTFDQTAIVAIIAATLAVLIWDRWRYDVVALSSLMACVGLGLVEPEAAFAGFSNPAVITVASVLAISHVLTKSGGVDAVVGLMIKRARSSFACRALFCLLGAFLSAFMNNVGALALLLPLARSAARRFGYSSATLLMPLSFATLLGGMVTLIGTPPNLLISDFRAQATGERFLLFDFAPVGLAVAAIGLAYLVLIGWRFIPAERVATRPDAEPFDITDYTTEARVPAASSLVGQIIGTVEESQQINVIGVVRDGRRVFARIYEQAIRAGDVLLLQADTATLRRLINDGELELVERGKGVTPPGVANASLVEAVVLPNALVQGSTPASLDLRRRWGVNLVAVSRQGRRFEGRLRDATLSVGDVLLLEGEPARWRDAITELGCLPLAERGLALGRRRTVLPIALFAAAIVLSAVGLVPAAVAFAGAILAMVLTRTAQPAEVYQGVDWSVIVLLGAMIPVGAAWETTGAAQVIAGSVLGPFHRAGPLVLLAVALLTTMAVTPVLNNAATVVMMAPIVIGLAEGMGVSPDPFLMAVAIGASCDFLTPFGHQNNAIILGPGGYRFGDFWRVGLILDVIVVVVSLALIPLVWPF